MSDKAKMQKQQQQLQYFKEHKDVKELYFTSDGQCFFKENDAENHGKSLNFHKLGSADVETVTREEAEGWDVTAQVQGVDNVPDGDVKTDMKNPATISDDKEEADNQEEVEPDAEEEEEEVPPYDEWSKPELVEECKARAIEFSSKATKTDLIELLEAYDDKDAE